MQITILPNRFIIPEDHDQQEITRAGELYRKISHVELGGSTTFSKYFMESMYLERLK